MLIFNLIMSHNNTKDTKVSFKGVNVIDDDVEEIDIIRYIVKNEKPEDAFFIVDVGEIINRHQYWISKMPKVTPYYAIKCNSHSIVIKILSALNACFDCASKQEIEQVMQYGVQAERIIFAHPNKLPSHIKYSKKMGVPLMTIDNEFELLKIKELYPEAKIVIHICFNKNLLEAKFGCEPYTDAICLIHQVLELDLNLHGFGFHVDTPDLDMEAYSKGIEICKWLIETAKEQGCEDIQLIDIGGGFPSCKNKFNKLAMIINNAIEDLDPNIKVISEPGQYYVESNFTLVSCLHFKRFVSFDDKAKRMYYTNCGVFNAFMDELLGYQDRVPQMVFQPISNELFLSNIWGPTTDPSDLILKDILLPELNIGDWLFWKNMGAYTLTLSNTFNGFPIPTVKLFIKKNQWENFRKLMYQKFPELNIKFCRISSIYNTF